MTRERTQRNHEAAIGVDEALARILTFFSPLPGDDVPLLDGLGRALAADVRARKPRRLFVIQRWTGMRFVRVTPLLHR